MKQQNISINNDRLWSTLMEMAKIGATEKGGVCRLTMTDLDQAGRALLLRWAGDAGYSHSMDAVGNLFIRRDGDDSNADPVMTGSHLDSQPTGGRFDGVYGVLAGLEVMRSLDDANIRTTAPVELAVWNNEEGSRFSPPMMGSGVFTGEFDLDWAYAIQDQEGISVKQELDRLDWIGDPIGSHKVESYFEAHIEQGPVLENEALTIGVVTGSQGQRWFELTVTGQEAHAGPTPMPLRKDALVCTAEIIQTVNQIGLDNAPHACATCGMIKVIPGSRNVIPGNVWLTIDLRHPDDDILLAMENTLRERIAEITANQSCEFELENFWIAPATPFDDECVSLVEQASQAHGYGHKRMISGAGHDAVYMAKRYPTAMIFVPCENGISHNEIENAEQSDIAAGCQVLFDAMLARAGQS
ncbi:MAG: Zn-dependent hydrolase [Acidiferrobacterales bacterium]|nr:Zn-dependent hydrolase [Acidiferrobacterales bacterium]